MKRVLPAKRKGKVMMSVYADNDNWLAYTLSGPGDDYDRLPAGRFTIIGEYQQQLTEDRLLTDIVAALTCRDSD